MLKIPKVNAARCATAAVYEGKQLKRVLAPIAGEAGVHASGQRLVPVTTSLKMVCAQAGTYSSLHVSITTTSLHPDGDFAARTLAVQQDVSWALEAFDSHAQQFNAVRHALGMSGEWKPSGR